MFTKKYLKTYFTYGLLAAILFCATEFIFLKTSNFSEIWWLFVGNGLFMCAIAFQIIALSNRKTQTDSTQNIVLIGFLTTITGILFSVIITTLLLFYYVPDIFHNGKSETLLENAPATMGSGKTDGLVFTIFISTLIGNFCGGSLAYILLPFTFIREKAKDSKSKVSNN